MTNPAAGSAKNMKAWARHRRCPGVRRESLRQRGFRAATVLRHDAPEVVRLDRTGATTFTVIPWARVPAPKCAPCRSYRPWKRHRRVRFAYRARARRIEEDATNSAHFIAGRESPATAAASRDAADPARLCRRALRLDQLASQFRIVDQMCDLMSLRDIGGGSGTVSTLSNIGLYALLGAWRG